MSFLGKLVRGCVFGYALLNVIYYYSKIELFFYAALVCLAVVFVLSITKLKPVSRNVILALLGISVALMIYGKADLSQWLKGCNKNGLLIALFVFGGMLNLPFTYENYAAELVNVAKLYMKDLIPFCLLISIPTHIFGALTGFAAFSIVYGLFLDTAKLYNAEDIFISTMGRAYSTGGFWGTSWAGVVLVVSQFGIPWYKLILLGIVFTLISWGINLLDIKRKMIANPRKFKTLEPDKSTVVNWKNIRIMLFLSLIIVISTLIINTTTGWDLLAIVPLVAMALPPLVAVVQGKTKEYKKGLKTYCDKSLYKSRTETCLFFAAGLLAAALKISGVDKLIPGLIPDFLINYPYLLIMTLMLLIIIPGQLGVHPVASGTTLLATIVPAQIGLTIPVFADAIICGWLLSNMMSPFSALNLTLSGLTGRTSFNTGLTLNWYYGVVCVIIYSAMVLLLGPLLG